MVFQTPRRLVPGRSPFDDIMHQEDDGPEWWSAREMMPFLGYIRWENIVNVIRRAMSACRNSGQDPSDVFREVTQTVDAGPLQRGRGDFQMLRFGCYLVAMNGDPDKPEVAAAQRYFAVMTRAAEIGKIAAAQMAAPTAIPLEWSIRFRETVKPHMRYLYVNHPGHFTVVTTLVGQMLALEDELVRHMLRPAPSDRPDVSIGLCWGNERRNRGMAPVEHYAPLRLPDQDLEVSLCVYSDSERGTFEAWFGTVYLPEKLPGYLTQKPSFKRYGVLPPSSAADHICQGIAGRPANLSPRVRKQLVRVGGFAPVGTVVPAIEDQQRNLFDDLG